MSDDNLVTDRGRAGRVEIISRQINKKTLQKQTSQAFNFSSTPSPQRSACMNQSTQWQFERAALHEIRGERQLRKPASPIPRTSSRTIHYETRSPQKLQQSHEKRFDQANKLIQLQSSTQQRSEETKVEPNSSITAITAEFEMQFNEKYPTIETLTPIM